MPTEAETVLASACDSGIGNVENPIQLLRLIAQIEADKLVALSPSAEVSVDAIMSRACSSGIATVQSEHQLLAIIAQLLHEQAA